MSGSVFLSVGPGLCVTVLWPQHEPQTAVLNCGFDSDETNPSLGTSPLQRNVSSRLKRTFLTEKSFSFHFNRSSVHKRIIPGFLGGGDLRSTRSHEHVVFVFLVEVSECRLTLDDAVELPLVFVLLSPEPQEIQGLLLGAALLLQRLHALLVHLTARKALQQKVHRGEGRR